MEIEDIFT